MVSTVAENANSVNLPEAKAKWENEHLSQIPFKVFRGHRNGVTSCQFGCDDKFILSSSKDGSTRLWNVQLGEIVHNFTNHSLTVSKSTLSPDCKRVLTSSWDKSAQLVEVEHGTPLWKAEHDGIVTHCDISKDGNLVATVSDFDNALRMWDMRDGNLVKEIADHHASTPLCCKFSPNSQRVATTSLDKTTKIWDMVSQKTTVKLSGHRNVVSSCDFSENERHLCTSSWDKSLQIWDISTGMFRSQGPSHLMKGHDGSVSCCKFTSGAQNLVSGGYDKAVVVWEVANKNKKIALKGHDGWVTGVDVSKDEKWILSSSEDKTIRVWNIEAADRIPAVVENRRAMGLKIVQCENCNKQFSIAQLDDPAEIRRCVFCRLADPERNKLPAL